MIPLEHYLRPPKRTLSWLLAAVAVVALVAAFLAAQALAVRERAADVESQASRLRSASVVRSAEKKTAAVLDEQKKWAVLQMERDFDWPGVFAAFEKAGGANVELLTFKPDKGNRQVLLGGEARDQKSLMEFLDVLSAQPSMKQVHLTLQQHKNRVALETVVFEVKARIVH